MLDMALSAGLVVSDDSDRVAHRKSFLALPDLIEAQRRCVAKRRAHELCQVVAVGGQKAQVAVCTRRACSSCRLLGNDDHVLAQEEVQPGAEGPAAFESAGFSTVGDADATARAMPTA